MSEDIVEEIFQKGKPVRRGVMKDLNNKEYFNEDEVRSWIRLALKEAEERWRSQSKIATSLDRLGEIAKVYVEDKKRNKV